MQHQYHIYASRNVKSRIISNHIFQLLFPLYIPTRELHDGKLLLKSNFLVARKQTGQAL